MSALLSLPAFISSGSHGILVTKKKETKEVVLIQTRSNESFVSVEL